MRDIAQDFQQNFVGMAKQPISLDLLLQARKRLIIDVTTNMPEKHKIFLRSFYKRNPQWELLDVAHAYTLPAVRWREINLDKSGAGTCETLLNKLEDVIN